MGKDQKHLSKKTAAGTGAPLGQRSDAAASDARVDVEMGLEKGVPVRDVQKARFVPRLPLPMAESPATPPERPPAAVIGAGALGTALARRLQDAGYPVAAAISRSERSARELAATVGAGVAASEIGALPTQATLVLLCVPDDQVRSVAASLADTDHPWPRCLVLHTSGALPAAALGPLAEAGATTLSFHPLQAFAEDTSPEAFEGIYVGLEGAEDAVAAGRPLAEALGARPFVLSEAAKARYHLAASMASNFLVTLAGLAGDILNEATADSREIDGPTGAEALRPLLAGTMRNLQDAPPSAALTGPLVRGDEDTVAAHLRVLRTHHPGALPAYAALATETVQQATRADRLPSDVADRLLAQLADATDARRESGPGNRGP
jgi:predicted short-subunit dehydrogenase-like oxidoreductase (DUF2520 family)